MRHLLSMADLSSADIQKIFAIAEDLKAKLSKGRRDPVLPGRILALLFEKPSLRTRVSFEAGMAHLGGTSIFLGEETGFGRRESITDFSRVLSEYADAVVFRSKRHKSVVELARASSRPVINGLSDAAHPCQALADLFTLQEIFGKLKGRTLAWIGDGNNVARDLAIGCGKLGMRFAMSTPEGYRFDEAFMEELRREAPGVEFSLFAEPFRAVQDAIAVYTDVWTSMGQEAEQAARRQAFAPYQVNTDLMAYTPHECVFMHCLPARRGEEVTDAVLDGPQSVVVRQAGNRMHVQKGVLVWLLGDRD